MYAGITAALYYYQDNLLYHPTPESNNPEIDDFFVENDGIRLKIWEVNPDRPEAVLYFGGNAEDVLGTAEAFRALLPDHTTYLVNYRGYSGSEGSPSQQSLYADAESIARQLRKRHDNFSIIGRSLGSAVAINLATKMKFRRLILVTPFDSIRAIAQQALPVFPVNWLLRDHYDVMDDALEIRTRTLVITASEDKIVPRANSERLIRALDPRRLREEVIPGKGHNTLGEDLRYGELLKEFIES